MRINRYEFLILFYAGLIKGVVAYALICEDEAGGE
jgi:sodium/hydrogen exchanger-like protein 6/7/sodium/hydrogen exchanger 8